MIETKCIRRFDELGRIVIPFEIRREVFGETVNIREHLMEISCEKDGTIILKPYQRESNETVKRVEEILNHAEDVQKYAEDVQKQVEQAKKDLADVKEQNEELAKELENLNKRIDAIAKEARRSTIAERIRKERES